MLSDVDSCIAGAMQIIDSDLLVSGNMTVRYNNASIRGGGELVGDRRHVEPLFNDFP